MYEKVIVTCVLFFMVHKGFPAFLLLANKKLFCFFFKKENATKSRMSETRVKFSHLITVEGF